MTNVPVVKRQLYGFECKRAGVAMRVVKFVFAVACVLSVFATLPAVAEDLTIVYKDTVPVSGTSIQYLSSTRTRHDHDQYANIADMVRGRNITIDHQKKEYYEDTAQEMEAAARLTQQRLEKMKTELKEKYAKMPPELWDKMSPEVRKVIHASLAERRESASLEKVSDHRTIAGYDCEHYVITLTHLLDGNVATISKYDHWVAPDLRNPSRAGSDWLAAPKNGALSSDLFRVTEEMADKGLSLASTMTFSSPETSNSPTIVSREAIKVKKGPIDPSVFMVPARYTKVESPAARHMREDGISGRK
jgi:hypothetical protein